MVYKGFDFRMLLQGVGKRDVFFPENNGLFWGFKKIDQMSLVQGNQLDYYRDVEATKYIGLGINTDAYFPRPYANDGMNKKNRQTSTRYLQSAAYMRLKNVQIGYTFPKSIITKIGLSRMRLYLSGENLGVLTNNYPKYLDPENATIGLWGQGGKSMAAQANYSFGIDVEF